MGPSCWLTRVGVMLVSFIRGERISAGLNSLGGVLWDITS